jgi:CheY-like chemotaxis protein
MRFLDLSWVHAELAPHYPSIGRPSIDPALMIRMLIVGYVFAIRSERALCRDVKVNLAYRWFCKLGIEDQIPDHSVQTSGATSDSQPRADLKGVRVLVVEDHWQVANALKSFLEVKGMKVSGPVATTADARRLATEEKPDLAVVDIHLKLETAYVLIHQLDDQGVRVVVLTGYAMLPALATKVVAVLQKPFNGPELLGALRRALSL